MTETYYKVLTGDGQSCHGGAAQWHLPQDGKPGAWMPEITDIVPCQRGYHIVTLDQLPEWLRDVGLWEVEPRGKIIDHGDKYVCEQARLVRRVNQWNPHTIRLLAALWIEHLIPEYYQKYYPSDIPALETLIDVTRRYAEGEATGRELADARAATRSSLSSSWPLSLSSLSSSSLLSWPSLSSLSSLSLLWPSLSSLSSLSSWLEDRMRELVTAPGDWTHVSWEEW